MADYPVQGAGPSTVSGSGSGTQVHHREGFVTGNATATVIGAVSTLHAISIFAEGNGQYNQFIDGVAGTTSAFADYGGTVVGTVKATSTAHGLSTGDYITIEAGSNYKGLKAITVIDANNFYFTATWVANDGAIHWTRGDYIIITQACTALISVTLSVTPETTNDVFAFKVYVGSAPMDNFCVETKLVSSTTLQNIALSGIYDCLINDRIWLGVINNTGAGDITIKHGNISVLQIP